MWGKENSRRTECTARHSWRKSHSECLYVHCTCDAMRSNKSANSFGVRTNTLPFICMALQSIQHTFDDQTGNRLTRMPLFVCMHSNFERKRWSRTHNTWTRAFLPLCFHFSHFFFIPFYIFDMQRTEFYSERKHVNANMRRVRWVKCAKICENFQQFCTFGIRWA